MDTSDPSLKAALDNLFDHHGLSISKLIGQGYDGASNMRGQFNGLKTLILKENPHAFYINCFAHQLQVVVVFIAKHISHVVDFFNYVSMIVNVVGVPCKRKDALLQKHHERISKKLEKDEIFQEKANINRLILPDPVTLDKVYTI